MQKWSHCELVFSEDEIFDALRKSGYIDKSEKYSINIVINHETHKYIFTLKTKNRMIDDGTNTKRL